MRARLALLAVLIAGVTLASTGAQAQSEGWAAAVDAALEAGDPIRATSILEAVAQSGDAPAQTRLGDLLRRGEVVSQDLRAAAQWYQRAADQGYAPAQNALGRLYFEGVGRPADRSRALELLGAAALQGSPGHGQDYALALEAADRLEAAAQWYARTADLGHAPAMTSLGVLALDGRGVEQDEARALALFAAAAEQGDARAQNNLGLMYARGAGVEQDYERAAGLFQAAADQGLAQALVNLAVLYENGFGVALDEAEAVRLYRDAARFDVTGLDGLLANLGTPWPDRLAAFDPSPDAAGRDAAAAAVGDPVARFALGYRFSTGDGRPVDFQQAARLYRASAEQGFAAASLNLGLLYIRGLGVPQDYIAAHGWLVRAAAAGEPGAAALRDAVFARMSEAQRALASEPAPTAPRD
ncbi:MAG: SEL1-like repeat protein [Oceanicaulis sp.]